MSNSDIRAKATVIREQTDRMITLFLAPVLISFLSGVGRIWLETNLGANWYFLLGHNYCERRCYLDSSFLFLLARQSYLILLHNV